MGWAPLQTTPPRRETMIRCTQSDNIRTTIAGLLILGVTISQNSARAFTTANVHRDGYEMRVRLDRTLSIMSSRVGDKFTATVADPGPFNLAKIFGHVESITQSQRIRGYTRMSLSFDSIRFSDGESYPINAEIVRLYDVLSGEQVDAGEFIETRGHVGPQTLKRTGIGALGGAIFTVTSGGGKPAVRSRFVGAGKTAPSARKELLLLDQGVEMLLRVYPNEQ
jgi:hypothetical protein